VIESGEELVVGGTDENISRVHNRSSAPLLPLHGLWKSKYEPGPCLSGGGIDVVDAMRSRCESGKACQPTASERYSRVAIDDRIGQDSGDITLRRRGVDPLKAASIQPAGTYAETSRRTRTRGSAGTHAVHSTSYRTSFWGPNQ